MAKEITVRCSLGIRTGNLDYRANPQGFTADYLSSKPNGPTPGTILVSSNGTDINLSQLTSFGGWAWFQNLDTANYVTIGVKDNSSGVFYPFAELLPGESFPVRLSRKLGEQEAGTGTFSGATAKLHAKANAASINFRADCFDP